MEPRPQGPAGSRVWGLDSQSAPQQAGEGSPRPQSHLQTREGGEEVPPSEPPVPLALATPCGHVSHPAVLLQRLLARSQGPSLCEIREESEGRRRGPAFGGPIPRQALPPGGHSRNRVSCGSRSGSGQESADPNRTLLGGAPVQAGRLTEAVSWGPGCQLLPRFPGGHPRPIHLPGGLMGPLGPHGTPRIPSLGQGPPRSWGGAQAAPPSFTGKQRLLTRPVSP